MAKHKKDEAEESAADVAPAFTPDEVTAPAPPAAPPAADPRDAEIAALKAELAAAKAATGPVYAAGKKYKVSLKDCGAAIVRARPGEHPWDAFRRVSGVVSSAHQPVITEEPDDAVCGHVNADGTVRPFAE